ncbi:hypothetical protein HDA32_000811 [Spinactinospora alkalitolerans]|uniref:Translation initiation factor 2 n=1 Tax=Spinactinospora alkalitolerans TaxID=687207 RepID=A0A852TQ87_9ACTN|nr:translation initiation factor IF-2 [Spinactinospora alkalitolerans]NYE45691.1 hypothetical protein [Spinactinospora alkalitolerans]
MRSRDDPWATVRADHEVLAVARSVPAANRLLDVVQLFGGDDRVEVAFTVPEGSVSQAGVEGLLRDAGVERIEPWPSVAADADRFALALAASPKGGLHRIAAPLVLMPHGAGHNRLVGDLPGDLPVASGLAPEQLLHDGRVVPERIALPHSEQLARLKLSCPAAAERAVVVGDPCYDRMLANAGRRERYRRALGAAGGSRLVAVSSTWNRRSLLGGRRDTVRDLLAELPSDEYRVALITHPNIWYRHGRAQLELWLADEIEAGLRLVPPHEGWRAALIGADVVVGDHGSVTYYAAALGRPVLLAASDTGELDPDSPLVGFVRGAPRLLRRTGLRGQIEAARGSAPEGAAELMMEYHGRSAERMRALLYDLLGIAPPPRPARFSPLAGPRTEEPDVTAWRVAAEIDRDGGAAVIRVTRYPAAVTGPHPDRFLLVDEEDTAMERRETAQVRAHRPVSGDPVAWVRGVLDGGRCALAAAAGTPGEVVLCARAGGWLRVRSETGADLDAAVVAAAAHAWTASGRALREWDSGVRITAGGGEIPVRGTPPR